MELFENQGDGTFAAYSLINFDDDPELELINYLFADLINIYDSENGDLSLAINLGQISYCPIGDHSLAFDFENDGDIDILSGNTVLKNDGDGTYLHGEPLIEYGMVLHTNADFLNNGYQNLITYEYGHLQHFHNCAAPDLPNVATEGIEQISWQMYPNAARDLIHFTTAKEGAERLTVKVSNVLGQTVMDAADVSELGLDVSGLPAGIYPVFKRSRIGKPSFTNRAIIFLWVLLIL